MTSPLKFGNGQVISSHTLLGIWLLTHAGIEVIPYSLKRPQGPLLLIWFNFNPSMDK